MDQLKTAMAWVAKYHFWLLSVLVVIISTLVWYMAAGDLDTRKDQNLGKIKTAFDQQASLRNRQLQPNPDFNAKQQAQNQAIAAETKQIWQDLYERQRQEVLKWPAQLPASFRQQVENKQFGDDINQLLREQYTDYIRGRFKDLPKIVNANEIEEDSSTGGFGGGSGEFGSRRSFGGGGFGGGGSGGFRNLSSDTEPELDEDGNIIEVKYTVWWNPEDQERIRAELDSPNTISHWRLWATQENLWVYETMLRAIAATNDAADADRYSNAAVSDISALQVGRDAAQQGLATGRITRLQGADSLSSASEFDDSSSDSASFSEDGLDEFDGLGGTGEGEMGNAEEKAFWLSRRYIDAEGLPISVEADDEPLDPGALGQELKRLPVRLVLRMDSRWLTNLMANLANADLQIKVTEVRVGVDAEASSGGYDGGAGGRGNAGFGGGGWGGGSEEVAVFDRRPYIKPVIIQGVVLIFNPPDDEILEGGESEASADQLTSSF